jgi:hypothetical protein
VTDRLAYERIAAGTARDPYSVLVGVPAPVDLESRLADFEGRVARAEGGFLVEAAALPAGGCRVTWEDGGFRGPQGRDLGLADIEALATARQKIGIEATLGLDWRADVRAVADFVQRLTPEFGGLFDEGGLTFWSSRWVRAIAAGRPVTLSELFEIHGVVDEGRLWAHTHGLRRLGLVELELRGDLDDVPFEFAGRVINAAAEAMHAAGVPRPGVAVRVGDDLSVEWTPWEDASWEDDELGGPADRDEEHSGPSGVLTPSRADAPLPVGSSLDDEGWVVYDSDLGVFEEHARATAAAVYGASRAPGRSMRLSSAQVEGTVEMSDGRIFTASTDDGLRVEVPIDDVESWRVSCAGDYSLGPWKAHNVPVIEDVAAARRATYDDEGRPLCSVCGTPLGGGHSCAG